MTIERRLARAGFTLTRDYPVALERVWGAFAEDDQKLEWFGAGDTFDSGSGPTGRTAGRAAGASSRPWATTSPDTDPCHGAGVYRVQDGNAGTGCTAGAAN